MTVARVDPTACAHCGAATLTQETDVLDTWFRRGCCPSPCSAGPHIDDKTKASFEAFYPTSLLVTGFDNPVLLGCPDDHVRLLVFAGCGFTGWVRSAA